jgi:hypothetical protein
MSKPHSINRFGGDDGGVAPLHVFYNTPAPIGFRIAKINWNGQSRSPASVYFCLHR